jgi:hypothetical protein
LVLDAYFALKGEETAIFTKRELGRMTVLRNEAKAPCDQVFLKNEARERGIFDLQRSEPGCPVRAEGARSE